MTQHRRALPSVDAERPVSNADIASQLPALHIPIAVPSPTATLVRSRGTSGMLTPTLEGGSAGGGSGGGGGGGIGDEENKPPSGARTPMKSVHFPEADQ